MNTEREQSKLGRVSKQFKFVNTSLNLPNSIMALRVNANVGLRLKSSNINVDLTGQAGGQAEAGRQRDSLCLFFIYALINMKTLAYNYKVKLSRESLP